VANLYRRHALIEAPIEDVWSIVSDPHTHPDWWPELTAVEVPEDADEEGGKYIRKTRRLGFLDMVDSIWVVEPMEHLHEVNFRCTASGTYTRFSLTPAQDDTFVEIEGGVVPISMSGRVAKRLSPLLFPRWLQALLDALPRVVRDHHTSPSRQSQVSSPSRSSGADTGRT
jgi:uncharacterized protein YndB with AHSA1/START domain